MRMNGRSMWDERYAQKEYVYGTGANVFFTSVLDQLEPGLLLLPGEGEGRNAAYALNRGWKVRAFDMSGRARDKAFKLAGSGGLHLEYSVCDLEAFDYKEAFHDAAALVFLHASPVQRQYLHSRVMESLKPGGRLILQSFSKAQLGRKSGGPKQESLLMDIHSLQEDFSSLDTLLMEERIVELDEGPLHQGEACIINYVGIKKQ